MEEKKLILPGVNASGGNGHQAAYIKHWRTQLQSALRLANLTPEIRDNLGAFIDAETRRVFVEKRWNPQDRLDHWWKNQQSPQTIAARAEAQMYQRQEQAKVDQYVAGIVRKATPQGYTLDPSDIQLINEQYSKIRNVGEIWPFDQWADGFLNNHLIQKQRKQAINDRARMDSRNESIRRGLSAFEE